MAQAAAQVCDGAGTTRVLGNSAVFENQLSHGLNHWLRRIPTAHGMYVFAEYGIAIGDVNGDGLEDLYVCQPGGLPNRLLIQNAAVLLFRR